MASGGLRDASITGGRSLRLSRTSDHGILRYYLGPPLSYALGERRVRHMEPDDILHGLSGADSVC